MRRLAVILLLSLILVAGAVAGGAYYWLKSAYLRPGPAQSAAVVLLPKGASVKAIADQLAEAKLIADPNVFRVAHRLFAGKKPLRAGEYEIPAAASAAAIVRVLQEGEQVVHKLTVAEGLVVREVAEIVTGAANLAGSLPEPLPPEGTLLPETYHYHHGDGRADMLRRMGQSMRDTLDQLWAARNRATPLRDKIEVLILASIVEKETGVAAERPRVAAVFLNRLKKGMRLQSDPTVVYGLTLGGAPLGRALTRADLDRPTPYNTYQIDGLPPGPIANPGRAAIAAVLEPADTDELYFVADGTGGHAFAKTLDEHNRNVRKWRQFQKNNP